MERIINLLKESGAMLTGHFLLSSGRHSDKYFQCAKLLQFPDKAQAAFEQAVQKIMDDIKAGLIKIDITAGPAMGGITAAYEAGRQLSVPAIFTERDDTGKMTLRRFDPLNGKNVLIVEDVVTTGKSSLECAAALEEAGAQIAGLACIVDRRAKTENSFPWPFYSAVKLEAQNWDASECELCRQGIPVVKPGSRKII
jgi:orotate phosphoribosyltransferase